MADFVGPVSELFGRSLIHGVDAVAAGSDPALNRLAARGPIQSDVPLSWLAMTRRLLLASKPTT